jgi:hypothetical protein
MGPAGADGTDGTNGTDGQPGVDGNVTCIQCHNTPNQDNKIAQFARSSHYGGEVDDGRESWSSSCVRCHTSQGFKEYAAGLTVGGLTGGENSFTCQTCHSIHSSFEATDYALRKSDAVNFIIDETVAFDGGNSNLCANCHQARTAEPNTAAPGTDFTITSTHYGPHHGPQANILAGFGFAEIAGSLSYPADMSATHYTGNGDGDAKCTGCHMTTGADLGEGGHTFMPPVEGCATCHTGATSFDINNAQTINQGLLNDIRDELITLGVVAGNDTDGYHPVTGTWPMVQAQAYYNWVGLSEDRSLGVHNPAYVRALLTNTKEALTP